MRRLAPVLAALIVVSIAALNAAGAFDTSEETTVAATIEIQFVPLEGDTPWWAEHAEVVAFPNGATLYVVDTVTGPTPLRILDGNDQERPGVLCREVVVQYGSAVLTITDRGAGEGELIVQDRVARGRSFYLTASGRLLTSAESDAASDDDDR